VRLYIAVVESGKRKGRRVTLAVHAASKRTARAMVGSRYTGWSLRILTHAPGEKCISFLDEFP
jgi:hypothetical protein